MVTDASTESRKVDKRTAQVLWDTTTLVGLRKKKVEQSDSEDESEQTSEENSEDDDDYSSSSVSKN